MSGKASVIGIDMGTSGARALAMTPDGTVLASAAARLSTFTDNHRDPKHWLAAFRSALSAVLDLIDRRTVKAIAIDGTSGTLLPVDDAGHVLAEPMMYNDPVADPHILQAIAARAPAESAAHGPTSGLAKLIRFQSIPNVLRVIHQADWLAGHLTGRFDLTDENNALKTGYDPILRRWPDWIAATGARPALLPTVLPAGALMAKISAQAARDHGLSADVIIAAGTTDGCASFLATGASQPGDGVSALGTTLTVKILSDRPLFAPEFGLYSHRIGDMWLAGGASNSGGGVLARYFEPQAIETLSARIDPETATGLDYYPLPGIGERFPVCDPALQPRLSPRPADDATFLKAMFEGIAGIEALAFDRLKGLGAPALRSIRSVGGGAKNPAWTTMRLKRLGVPAAPVQSEEAAAGAAIVALRAAQSEALI